MKLSGSYKASLMGFATALLMTGAIAETPSVFAEEESSGGRVSEYDFMTLPDLPNANLLNRLHIGQRYRDEAGEAVVFVGAKSNGVSLAFSLTDVPQSKMTFDSLKSMCAQKGPDWALPELEELQRFTAHVDMADPQALPGGYWTNTRSYCGDCKGQDIHKVVYDVKSSATLSRYTHPIFKHYGVCVKRF